jgi:hypothetical protein
VRSLSLTIALLVEACGLEATPPPSSDTAEMPVAHASGPAEPAPPSASQPTTSITGPLARFVGHYPFDLVEDETILTNDLVIDAVKAAVPDLNVRSDVLMGGVSGPIRIRGGRIVSWGCQPHMCNRNNWTIIVGGSGDSAEVCYYEESMGRNSQWFRAGTEPEMREWRGEEEGCPHG